jgi:5-methylthioribose kinase
MSGLEMDPATEAQPLSDSTLPAYLCATGLADSPAGLRVEPAGDGNINWVRRVRSATGDRSWIVKQARPALERFPEYHASTERIVFEHRYFELVRDLDVEGVCPEVRHFDAAARVLVLEDLGEAERLDHALSRGADVAPALRALGRFLAAVHAATRDPALAGRFANDEMQRLHGEHIFVLPFRANDFPLEPAVGRRALEVQADAGLVTIAGAAYARYLEPRGALVHGDVQAGNVLLLGPRPKLLDAEIAHVGDPAFDVGTLVAHVLLAALGRRGVADAVPLVDELWNAYRTTAHSVKRSEGRTEASGGPPSFADVGRYAGVEVMRRTIGAARVAAVTSSDRALAAIELAASLMREPPGAPVDLRREVR